MRNVEDRLKWFLANRPSGPGRCAEYTMQALDVPRQGFPDATAMARRVQADGNMQSGPCPRGALRYWDKGSDGHGHVGIEYSTLLEPSAVASVDVLGPGSVGIKPLSWFEDNWPSLRYVGWSWYFGGINTEEVDMAPTFGLPLAKWPVGKTPLHKTPLSEPVTVEGGKWYTGAIVNIPKGGRFDLSFQVRMPAGVGDGEVELVRLGWPGLAKEDSTGHNPVAAAKKMFGTWRRWRTPIRHSIDGGGPVAYRILLPEGRHKMRFVAKATRVS